MATSPKAPTQRYKLIFNTPKASLEAIKAAVFATGAGSYDNGKYINCCFESYGIGQFQPVAGRGANPAIGEKKDDGSGEFRLERVEEVRCEVWCEGKETAKEAVKAMKKEHPYEIPPYEVAEIDDEFQ